MRTSVLTSPTTVATLKKSEQKREENKRKKDEKAKEKKASTSKKRGAKESLAKKRQDKKAPAKVQVRHSSSSSNTDFCILCMKDLPKKLNKNNSINCNTCDRPVHLKCANITGSYYTCHNCDTD